MRSEVEEKSRAATEVVVLREEMVAVEVLVGVASRVVEVLVQVEVAVLYPSNVMIVVPRLHLVITRLVEVHQGSIFLPRQEKQP